MINPSFTRGEYWLLERVIEASVSIGSLDPNWKHFEEYHNKETHGLSRKQLANTLFGLFSDGLIYFKDSEENKVTPNISLLELGAERAKSHVQANGITYWLTSKGGEYWEAFSRPDWKCYLSRFSIYTKDGEQYQLICMDKKLLEQYYKSHLYYEMDAIANSIKWDELKPWQATYWKELPVGYRVCFAGERRDRDFSKPDRPNPGQIDKWWYALKC